MTKGNPAVLAVCILSLSAPLVVADALPSVSASLLDGLALLAGASSPEVLVWDTLSRQVVETLPWEAFAERMASTPLGGPVPSGFCSAPGGLEMYCGPDAGHGAPQLPGGLCVDAAWVAYTGAPAGSAFTALVPSPEPLRPTCACPTDCAPQVWEVAELSGSWNSGVLAGLLTDGCYGSTWLLHGPGYCPNSDFSVGSGGAGPGALNTFLLQWRAHGGGGAVSYTIGGVVIDVFWGMEIDMCYDLPGGACPDLGAG